MDTDFLRTLDRQILLGVFVAFIAAGAGAAYYLSSSKKRRAEATESMEASPSVIGNRKRKAEFELDEEECDGVNEVVSDEKSIINEPEPEMDMLKAPEWDVDSFDGLEYYSSPELTSSTDDDKEGMAHTRIYKRQIIESKGYYVDPELTPCVRFKGIRPIPLEVEDYVGKTYGEYWKEIVIICLQKYNQDRAEGSKLEFVQVVRGNRAPAPRSKSYITFMAREKPNGPLVEYQAKALLTFDGIRHPILCRPAPKPKL